ncbi:MAG: FAD-binding oxidoreductase [Actinobacteria bacterium]|nr:FAD-binding oxidoreductase [Actinomycetota bacterium]
MLSGEVPRWLGARLGSLAADLALVVGDAHVLTDREVAAGYAVDWTGRYGAKRALVVRPATTAETSAVVDLAASYGVPIVTQGGNTGLVGGSVPNRHDSLIVSTRRLGTISDVDLRAGLVTVGAGVTVTGLTEHLKGSGWRFAVDLGSRDSATLGGMTATNAGGMRVFRFGTMRRQIVGLEYVAADGTVASHLRSLIKDNTGYHLAGLLCGSEGTLGLITALRLRLIRERTHRLAALCAFDDLDEAVEFAWQLRATAPSVEVIEYLDAACADLVHMTQRVPLPVRGQALILVEAAADTDPLDEVAGAIGRIQPSPTDVAFALGEHRRAALWRLRDEVSLALSRLGAVHKFDISIPAGTLSHVRRRLEAGLHALAPQATAWWFGHVCDDNVHLNVTGPDLETHRVEELVVQVVLDAAGSISAEHGIGVMKAPFLHHARSAGELAHMRAIKEALDPQGILNPGVIFAER